MSFHFIFVTNFIRNKNPLYSILSSQIKSHYHIPLVVIKGLPYLVLAFDYVQHSADSIIMLRQMLIIYWFSLMGQSFAWKMSDKLSQVSVSTT